MFTKGTAQSRLVGEDVMMQAVPPHGDRGGVRVSRLLTPAGGLMVALGGSALLWTGVAAGFHLLHIF